MQLTQRRLTYLGLYLILLLVTLYLGRDCAHIHGAPPGVIHCKLNFDFVITLQVMVLSLLTPLVCGIANALNRRYSKLQDFGVGLVLGSIIGFFLNLLQLFIIRPFFFPFGPAPVGLFNILFIIIDAIFFASGLVFVFVSIVILNRARRKN